MSVKRAGRKPVRRRTTQSPGEHLRAEIKLLCLDQTAVAKATDATRQTINNIINGRYPISRAMARKLGTLTGHRPDYWLRDSFPSQGGVDERPRRSSLAKPERRVAKTPKPRSGAPDTFRAFALSLAPKDPIERNIVAVIKWDRKFPKVAAWEGLEQYFKSLGAIAAEIDAVRRLWSDYKRAQR